jgi:hypothetical protein
MMLRSKKGQLAILGIVFGLIVFVILWALFFGEWVNLWAQQAITANNLTGIEAFLMANMNLWIGVGLIIGSVASVYLGGSR